METLTIYSIQIDKRGDDFVLIEQGITGPDNTLHTEVHALSGSPFYIAGDLFEIVQNGEMLAEVIKNFKS